MQSGPCVEKIVINDDNLLNGTRTKEIVNIQKTREVVNGIRKMHPGGPQQGGAFIADLSGAILKHGATRTKDSE